MKNVVILAILFCSNAIFASSMLTPSPKVLSVDSNLERYLVHEEHAHEHEDGIDAIVCQCACTLVVVIDGNAYIFSSYTNNAQTYSNMSDGLASYDAEDCQDGAGMLNAQSVEEFRAAESGGGC
jgi:hypothetical protein